MHRFIILVCLATVILQSLGQPAVCPYKECVCQSTIIDCSFRQLRAIPVRLNPGQAFSTLYLNGNFITTINNTDSLPIRLAILDLSLNPITVITPESLFGISQTLKELTFKNSTFTTLPTSLELLDNLDTLDFENNVLTFNDNTVSKLAKSVLNLRIVNIGLTGWPTWLARFFFLRKLFLDNNPKLANPPVGALAPWGQELTDLSLSNTGISSLSTVSVLQKLQYLDASRNLIADAAALSYDLIPTGNTLKFLNLSSNSLTILPRLTDLRVLEELHLANNKIANINVGAFSPTIVNLNLDNNLFTTIPTFLNDLPLLQTFTIRNNLITLISGHDFPVNSRFTALYLGGNAITYIDEHGFDNLRNYLTILDLEGTKLTRLPLALKSLSKLDTLWIPNNQNLVCTCEEKDLTPWVVSLPTLNVLGQCGSIDIKEFLGQLASLCP